MSGQEDHGTGNETNLNGNMSVSFPADLAFTRIGRVTIAGLALRLGMDIAAIDRLRQAVDIVVLALKGQGRVSVKAKWQRDRILINISNTTSSIENTSDLSDQLTKIINPDPDSNEIILFRAPDPNDQLTEFNGSTPKPQQVKLVASVHVNSNEVILDFS